MSPTCQATMTLHGYRGDPEAMDVSRLEFCQSVVAIPSPVGCFTRIYILKIKIPLDAPMCFVRNRSRLVFVFFVGHEIEIPGVFTQSSCSWRGDPPNDHWHLFTESSCSRPRFFIDMLNRPTWQYSRVSPSPPLSGNCNHSYIFHHLSLCVSVPIFMLPIPNFHWPQLMTLWHIQKVERPSPLSSSGNLAWGVGSWMYWAT